MTGAAQTPRKASVGLLGGTFNPIHLAHLRVAEEVREALGLEHIVFVPAAAPPHKSSSGSDPIAPAAERLAWVRAAIDGNPHFGVDDLELGRSGPSFTVDTLRVFAERLAPERPVFVIGCDAMRDLGSWREPEALFTLAHFAVMTRPPLTAADLASWLPDRVRGELEISPDGREARHRTAPTWVRAVEVSALAISASDIRARLRDGRSIRYLVPEAVREALEKSRTYEERTQWSRQSA